MLKNFTADFGTNIIHHFTTGGVLDINEKITDDTEVLKYPNLVNDVFYLLEKRIISVFLMQQEVWCFNLKLTIHNPKLT